MESPFVDLREEITVLSELKDDYKKSLDIMTNNYAVLVKENTDLKRKAGMWDTLAEKISKFYVSTEGEYDENEPENDGDLTDIGEIAAIAFGWL